MTSTLVGCQIILILNFRAFSHFQSRFFGTNPVKSCPMSNCDYKSNSSEHVLIHVGLTHQKINEFIPESAVEVIFGSVRKDEAAKKPEVAKEGLCIKCNAEFATKDELKDHQVRMGH